MCKSLIKISMIVLVFNILFLSNAWCQLFDLSGGEVVARVKADKISSDFIEMLISENVAAEKDVRKTVNQVIDDILLSEEALKIGLSKSPQVVTRLNKNLDHLYVSVVIKSNNRSMTLYEIGKRYNKLYSELISSYLEQYNIKYVDIDPLKALAETKDRVEKRKEILVATMNDTRIYLQDVLDMFPNFKEQSFIESFYVNKQKLILKGACNKLIKNEFVKLEKDYPILKEYVLRTQENTYANSYRALSVNQYSRYFKSDTSDEQMKVKAKKFNEDDLKNYYRQNPEKFKIAEYIKAKYLMVKNSEQVEVLQQIRNAKSHSLGEFNRIVEKYVTSRDLTEVKDLGLIYNPIFRPEIRIPRIIPWDIARITLFKLQKGEVSHPFRNEEGFAVLYVYERKETIAPISSEWAKQTAKKYLKLNDRRKSLKRTKESLRNNTDIMIDQDVLAEIENRI